MTRRVSDEMAAEIAAMAAAALPYQPSRLNEEEGMYEPSDSPEKRDWKCPLCNGEGEIEGARYDAKTKHAGTVVAYGLGEGLELSEAWVEGGADSVNDLLADRAADLSALRQIAQRDGDMCPICRCILHHEPHHPTSMCPAAIAERALEGA